MSILRNLFGRNKKTRLSKSEFWAKFELLELINDLTEAQKLIENFDSPLSSVFIDFKDDLEGELFDVSHDNVPDFTQTWKWFESNGLWNQLLLDENEELRIRIHSRADRWKRNNEFVHGSKVKMNGEFGLVLLIDGKELIRWDTNQEVDTEDWSGLFGTFKDNGGTILDQDFNFQFIDETGKISTNK